MTAPSSPPSAAQKWANKSAGAAGAGPGQGLKIAIDGPAASGKSTLGEALARRLDYAYVDSGVVYRAVTLLAQRRGLVPGPASGSSPDTGAARAAPDTAALTDLATEMNVEVTRPTAADGRQYTVLVNGEDVTWALRSPAVDAGVSAVSAVPGVRQAAQHHLRRLISHQGTVMVGRDIGTVVLPDADLKIYLTASPAARARRRAAELTSRGEPADEEAILDALRRRDAIDGTRETAPMRPAPDAVRLSSDDKTVDDEVAFVLHSLARLTRRPEDPAAGPRPPQKRPETGKTDGDRTGAADAERSDGTSDAEEGRD